MSVSDRQVKSLVVLTDGILGKWWASVDDTSGLPCSPYLYFTSISRVAWQHIEKVSSMICV